MANVLCVGIHSGLVETRQLLLENWGHTVVTATSDAEIAAACRSMRIDVAVIGQVESAKAKIEWAETVRRYCPSVRIVEIFLTNLGMALTDADAWLSSPAEPAQLAERVSALARTHKRAANQ